MFAARKHAYLSPLHLNLCSSGMDRGTRHIQSCLLLHSPTNASMHDRCIRRYLKFRGLCLCLCFLGIVYVEWASRVNFVTIFGDLYQNRLWVICNNSNQFANLSSASGPSNDVIKMAAIVLLMFTYKTSYLQQ